MNVLLTFVILGAPFGIAALLSWATGYRHPGRAARFAADRDGFGPDGFGPDGFDFDGHGGPYDADAGRIGHDAAAVRTRFEHSPRWPASGVTGERR